MSRTYDRPTLPAFHAAPLMVRELREHLESVRKNACSVTFDDDSVTEAKAYLFDLLTDVEYALVELEILETLVKDEIAGTQPEAEATQ